MNTKATPKQMPSQAYLKEILDYNVENGIFRWRKRPQSHFKTKNACKIWNSRYPGKEAGTLSNGYTAIRIQGKGYYAHRLAWKYVTGAEPTDQIDHENLNKARNEFSNLREASNAQNGCNSLVRPHSKVGLKGVHFHKRDNLYQARIRVKGKTLSLGFFKSPQAAHEAYKQAADKYNGEFANYGQPII